MRMRTWIPFVVTLVIGLGGLGVLAYYHSTDRSNQPLEDSILLTEKKSEFSSEKSAAETGEKTLAQISADSVNYSLAIESALKGETPLAIEKLRLISEKTPYAEQARVLASILAEQWKPPDEQVDYHRNRERFAQLYRTTRDAMHRKAILRDAQLYNVRFFGERKSRLENWFGRVVSHGFGKDLVPTMKAKKYLIIESVEAGISILYRTEEREVSDVGKSMIQFGTPVYRQLQEIKPAEVVRFSGYFIGENMPGEGAESGRSLERPILLCYFENLTRLTDMEFQSPKASR